MNKKVMIAVVAAIIVAILGFGIYQSTASSAEPEYSKKEIKDLIDQQYPGTVTDLKLEKDTNNNFYTAEIENGENKYSVRLNGDTGEVLNMEMAGKINDEGGAEADSSKDKSSNTAPDQKDQAGTPENEKKETGESKQEKDSSSNAMISQDRAKEIALAQFQGEIVEMELDEDDGRQLYEIELENGDNEATIEIDAYTGKIVVLEIDIEEDDDED